MFEMACYSVCLSVYLSVVLLSDSETLNTKQGRLNELVSQCFVVYCSNKISFLPLEAPLKNCEKRLLASSLSICPFVYPSVESIRVTVLSDKNNRYFTRKRLRWSGGYMPASVTRVRGFEPGRSLWIFRVSE